MRCAPGSSRALFDQPIRASHGVHTRIQRHHIHSGRMRWRSRQRLSSHVLYPCPCFATRGYAIFCYASLAVVPCIQAGLRLYRHPSSRCPGRQHCKSETRFPCFPPLRPHSTDMAAPSPSPSSVLPSSASPAGASLASGLMCVPHARTFLLRLLLGECFSRSGASVAARVRGRTVHLPEDAWFRRETRAPPVEDVRCV